MKISSQKKLNELMRTRVSKVNIGTPEKAMAFGGPSVTVGPDSHQILSINIVLISGVFKHNCSECGHG